MQYFKIKFLLSNVQKHGHSARLRICVFDYPCLYFRKLKETLR